MHMDARQRTYKERKICKVQGCGKAGQMEMMDKKHNRFVLLIVLPLVVLACISLWYALNYGRVDGMTRVKSDNGVFDLSDADFSDGFFRLTGDVSYIPGILIPEEFMAQKNEAQNGNLWDIPFATSRIRILVPDDRIYMITAASIDFAHRLYVNSGRF